MKKKANSTPNGPGALSWLPWTAAVAVIAVIAVIAVVSAKGSQVDSVKAWDEGAPVSVDGEGLPALDVDDAAGAEVPLLSGSSALDGTPVEISGAGKGKLIAVFAHWCPHCQREVPQIVSHLSKNDLPDDVELFGVSTAMDERQPNFPPSEWLTAENWEFPTITDDADNTISTALGVTGFPFFVAVDADNNVVGRVSGAISMQQFDGLVAAVSPSGATPAPAD